MEKETTDKKEGYFPPKWGDLTHALKTGAKRACDEILPALHTETGG